MLWTLARSGYGQQVKILRTTGVCACHATAAVTGEDAYRKIRAGASLVEVYTAFAYEGPVLIPAIKQQLAECLARDGFSSVSEAVGADHKQQQGKLARRKSWLGA